MLYNNDYKERAFNMNYNLNLKKILNQIDKKKKPSLLLHSCCGPCSSYVITYLKDYFEITVYYYNSNIYPIEEYKHREYEQLRLLKALNIKYLDSIYDDEFNIVANGLEDLKEGELRCYNCIKYRMENTCVKAKVLNFDYFATTLSVSPHKNALWINEIGLNLEDKYNVKYLVSDFKKEDGYKKSIEIAKEYNLYRQDYCGCKYSLKNRRNGYEQIK